MPKLNDAYRDQLTEEEITAFEAENEDDAADALEALANGEAPDEDDTPPDAGDTSPTEDDDDPIVQEEPAKTEQKAAPKQEAQPEPVPDVSKAKQALDAIKAERKALREKYDDGDLTDDEYDAQNDALDDRMANAAADIKTAERSIAKQQDAWKQAGAAYLERYPGLKTNGVIQALDKAVQELAAYPSVANLPHEQFLERVHRKLIAEAEFTGLDIPAIGKSKQPPKKAAPDGDDSLGKTPKTLASVPSSDVSNLDDSPYASLERMAERGDPIAFEEAMMKLPADKRDQFASMYIE